jgi:hypothetical protein
MILECNIDENVEPYVLAQMMDVGDVDGVLRVLEITDNPCGLILSCCGGIFSQNRSDILVNFLPLLPDDHYCRAILMYLLAPTVAKTGDMETCDRLIQNSAALFIENIEAAGKGSSGFATLYNMLLHAFYFDPTLDVRTARPDLGNFDINAIGTYDGQSGPVLLASGNGLYIDLFGESFIHGVPDGAALSGIHLHVVNPTAESERLLATIAAGSTVPLSWTTEKSEAGLAYLACARFIIAGRVMRRMKRDLIIADLDGTFITPEALDCRFMLGEADAGLFENAEATELQQICHCSISYWRHSEGTETFLDLLANYNLDRLSATDCFWMLDQLSLFVLSRRAQRGEFDDILGSRGFVWADLSKKHGDRGNFQRDTEMPRDKKYSVRRRHQDNFFAIKECSIAMLNGRLNPNCPSPGKFKHHGCPYRD